MINKKIKTLKSTNDIRVGLIIDERLILKSNYKLKS